jgi:hypothetical protein
MSIRLYTDDPQGLLDTLYEAIDDGEAPTWDHDDDGDFIHTPSQWENEAWLQPGVEAGVLVLTILHPKDQAITSEVYAVYHGRFVEFALNHADQLFTKAEVSAQAEGDDLIE